MRRRQSDRRGPVSGGPGQNIGVQVMDARPVSPPAHAFRLWLVLVVGLTCRNLAYKPLLGPG